MTHSCPHQGDIDPGGWWLGHCCCVAGHDAHLIQWGSSMTGWVWHRFVRKHRPAVRFNADYQTGLSLHCVELMTAGSGFLKNDWEFWFLFLSFCVTLFQTTFFKSPRKRTELMYTSSWQICQFIFQTCRAAQKKNKWFASNVCTTFFSNKSLNNAESVSTSYCNQFQIHLHLRPKNKWPKQHTLISDLSYPLANAK